jgi:hypothetical protein
VGNKGHSDIRNASEKKNREMAHKFRFRRGNCRHIRGRASCEHEWSPIGVLIWTQTSDSPYWAVLHTSEVELKCDQLDGLLGLVLAVKLTSALIEPLLPALCPNLYKTGASFMIEDGRDFESEIR